MQRIDRTKYFKEVDDYKKQFEELEKETSQQTSILMGIWVIGLFFGIMFFSNIKGQAWVWLLYVILIGLTVRWNNKSKQQQERLLENVKKVGESEYAEVIKERVKAVEALKKEYSYIYSEEDNIYGNWIGISSNKAKIGFLHAIQSVDEYKDFYVKYYSLTEEEFNYYEIYKFDPESDYIYESNSTGLVTYSLETGVELPVGRKQEIYKSEEIYDFLKDILPGREKS